MNPPYVLSQAQKDHIDEYFQYCEHQEGKEHLAELLPRLTPKQIKELRDRALSMLQGPGRRRELRVYGLISMYRWTYRKQRDGRSMWKWIAAKVNETINAENPDLHCNYSIKSLHGIYRPQQTSRPAEAAACRIVTNSPSPQIPRKYRAYIYDASPFGTNCACE